MKRRFKEGRSEVLVRSNAAAEGLNFQFCCALVNYDSPNFSDLEILSSVDGPKTGAVRT